ncbi:MAG: MFS transporter [Ignavibacteriales bacterium]|nr:MFS transporter [Ignavibacteriales bacterium]MCF8306651.1 MFS transporter [Ignavibacteriales bacterium]MCF8316249.1 MFS transporter [Ignavibacteriales bacterium]MCF8437833.1 MFS transporter [Ignavibacteriales bacterium]
MNPSKNKNTIIKWLTFMMFMMFAMTTDAVGVIIPEVMRQFELSMTAAGMLHYAPMIAIAFSGILFGYWADKLGRKNTIALGLALFVINSYLFVLGDSFVFFLSLMVVSGMSIGIFKTGALALIGDISISTKEHTSTMNAVEGFFGIGAFVGPLIVGKLLQKGMDWKWLYLIAGTLSLVLMLMAIFIKYPKNTKKSTEIVNFKDTFKLMKNKYAIGFSLAAFFYVAVECAIYVWMPTLLKDYDGSLEIMLVYALPIFFILRAMGRFFGIWMISRFNWTVVMTISSFFILIFFSVSVILGAEAALILLPASGLFMSVIYPTINSKGISCFPKERHGSVAGIILFFTAGGAALGPLAMGLVSDMFGSDAFYGFILAAIFAAILFLGALFNWIFDPTKQQLKNLDALDYHSLK